MMTIYAVIYTCIGDATSKPYIFLEASQIYIFLTVLMTASSEDEPRVLIARRTPSSHWEEQVHYSRSLDLFERRTRSMIPQAALQHL